MSRYRTKYVTVETEVSIEEFDTEDLIEELEDRGHYNPLSDTDNHELLETIWQKRRTGRDYQAELDSFIWQVLGKM